MVRSPKAVERQRLNHVWRQMIRRCTAPACKQFQDYGGRGITVCERWASFDLFLQDMGPRPSGYVMDRIDNDKGYSPDNCRWVTRKVSNSNRRNVMWVDWRGELMNLKDAAAASGLAYRMVKKRVEKGMDPILALSIPSRVSARLTEKEAA